MKETTGPAFKAFPFCGDGGLSPGRHSRESAVRGKRCAEGVQEGPAGGCSEGPGPLSDITQAGPGASSGAGLE